MPLPSSLEAVTSQLPYALRQEVEGYIRTVQDAEAEIYREADVTRQEVSSEYFLLVTTVWRLYSQVEGQRWVMQNSLEVAREFGASGISAGRFRFASGSDDLGEMRELHQSFERWIDRRDLNFVKVADGPREVLEALRPGRDAR